MKTLQEMIQAGERILFISPNPLRTIKIGIDLSFFDFHKAIIPSSASVTFSYDGETFDDVEFIIDAGKKLELSVGVKIAAIKMQAGSTTNGGMICWSY